MLFVKITPSSCFYHELYNLIVRLKGLNLIDEKSIDYKSLIENDLFQHDYIRLARELKSLDLDGLLSDNQDAKLMAFFISKV